MTAARMQPGPLKAATFQTLTGLLAVTGMRGSEAMALDRGDLDAAAGLLTIRATKFRKSRQLPLQPSTVRALAACRAIRDRLCPSPATCGCLLRRRGCASPPCRRPSAACSAKRDRRGHARPRAPIHGLPHTFAAGPAG
jgi:integrase/recombinase XerD